MLAARTRLSEALQSKAAASSDPGNSAGERVDPVQVEMLLGKAYSTWDGHTGDAIAVYDNIIASFPDDFRGYLAKVTQIDFLWLDWHISFVNSSFRFRV